MRVARLVQRDEDLAHAVAGLERAPPGLVIEKPVDRARQPLFQRLAGDLPLLDERYFDEERGIYGNDLYLNAKGYARWTELIEPKLGK